MGLEATCDVRIGARRATLGVHLDTAEVQVRDAKTLRIPFVDITSATVKDQALHIRHRRGELVLALGAKAAEQWALKIRYPKGRVEKLGVKGGMRVALAGRFDLDVTREIESAGGRVTARLGAGPYDMVLARLDSQADLSRLAAARTKIIPAGMIWAVWPKGRREFREDDIRAFAARAGLVDVKVLSFSDQLSGLKLVIPKALR